MSDLKSQKNGKKIIQQLQAGQDRGDLLNQIGEIFPDFSTVITEDQLFGKVWSRITLSQRERILITLALLVASRCTNVLKAHIRYALNSGLSREEIQEVILHTANYTCWGAGVEAIRLTSTICSGE
jgi:alkylhydroperoxidase/carboxymuconolactone decarboxylase family protein YurZ